MVAVSYGADDKVSKSGDTMTGTLTFQGSPPFTVVHNAIAGTVTLNGTTAVVVSTTAVDANSVIQLTVQPGTAPVGQAWVSAISAGASFSVKSTSTSDTAVAVGWYIVEHS
jgi:hypothetical protein